MLGHLVVAKEVASTVLILPGIHGSGDLHWQTAWERELPQVARVQAPDWDRPVCDDWVQSLEQAVARAGSDVVLVAHSLGCLQLAHWASRTGQEVRAALLVAPPDPASPNFPGVARGFAPLPRARFRFTSTLVASSNDPFASLGFARDCAEVWGSRLIEVGAHGHINADSDLGDWRQGQTLLAALLR